MNKFIYIVMCNIYLLFYHIYLVIYLICNTGVRNTDNTNQ